MYTAHHLGAGPTRRPTLPDAIGLGIRAAVTVRSRDKMAASGAVPIEHRKKNGTDDIKLVAILRLYQQLNGRASYVRVISIL